MKKLKTSYNPSELKEILDIAETAYDPASIVIALHKKNYKIIKLTPENCIDYQEKDV